MQLLSLVGQKIFTVYDLPYSPPCSQAGGKKANAFFSFFCISRSQWFFAFFAFFCICFAFSFLLMSQSMDKFVSRGVANDAAADVDDTPELHDGEGDNEPDLEEPEEPEKKKVKLNYGAKTTPASRARQYPSGTFEVQGDCMWCCACQKPVCHTRKSIADQHLDRPSHKKKEKAMQKVKEPESGTAPTATPATPSTKVIEGPVAPKVQGDVKKVMSVHSAINDARDDPVAAFTPPPWGGGTVTWPKKHRKY